MLSHIGGIWWTFPSSSPFYVQLDCSYWEVDCFKRYVKEQEPISLLTNSLLPLFVPLIVDMKQILTFLKLECSGDTHEIIKIHGQKLSFKWNAYRQSLLKRFGLHLCLLVFTAAEGMFRGSAGFPQQINFQNINQLSWAIDRISGPRRTGFCLSCDGK